MAGAKTPGRTYCLLIGAARPSIGQEVDGSRLQVEREDRQFEATQMDLAKMVDWCAKFVQRRFIDGRWKRVFPIHVDFFVNDDRLIPITGPTSLLRTDEGKHMMDGWMKDNKLARAEMKHKFSNKTEVRDRVKSSIKRTSQDNVIIFFSGHGALTAPSGANAGYSVFSPNSIALGKLMHHVLVLPQSIDPPQEGYTDEELTNDVESGLKDGRKDRNVYLVLQACNSGGMFRDWQLETALRGENGLSIALFASAAGASTSQWNSGGAHSGYVSIFTESAEPGETLNTIQRNIFTRSLAEAPGYAQPGHSPCLQTIRPSMADDKFLPE